MYFGISYLKLYTEINIICTAIILVITARCGSDIGRNKKTLLFRHALISSSVLFISDNVWFAMDQGFIIRSYALEMLIKSIYFLAFIIMSFCWWLYFNYLQNKKSIKLRRVFSIDFAPVVLEIILLLINIKIPILFGFDNKLQYFRGNFFSIQYIIGYFYFAISSITALLGAFKEENYAERNRYLNIFMFPVLPAICGIVQFFDWRLPVACVGITFSSMTMYMSEIRSLISKDQLTNISNRRQILSDIQFALNSHHADGKILVLMIDVDFFKEINDTYGHERGDEVLKDTAIIIRDFASDITGRRQSVGRLGGDEFIAMIELDEGTGIDMLINRLTDAYLKYAKDEGLHTSLSIGYATNNKPISVREIIRQADNMMYENKKRNHKERR